MPICASKLLTMIPVGATGDSEPDFARVRPWVRRLDESPALARCLSTVALPTALDATLKVEDAGGAPILRLIDNPSSAILAERLIDDDLDAIDEHGNVYAPEGPGIGVPLDWDWIKAHQVDHAVLAERK